MNRQDMVDRYLEDLDLRGADLSTNDAALAFLNQLQSRHVATYTFNSLGVVIGSELSLDLPDLYEKIVVNRRGGYCFEHNKWLFNVLEQLGFEVTLSLARVVYNREVDVPRTHRITVVKVGGDSYVLDGGFGHLGARLPVKIEHELEQKQGDECFRIIEKGSGHYCYQTLKEGEFFTLYTFDLNHYTDADCLVGHFYSHRHPDAAFVNNLVVSRKTADAIYSLRNGDFHVIRNGQTTINTLLDSQSLHDTLTNVFDLDVDIAVSEFLTNKFVTPQD